MWTARCWSGTRCSTALPTRSARFAPNSSSACLLTSTITPSASQMTTPSGDPSSSAAATASVMTCFIPPSPRAHPRAGDPRGVLSANGPRSLSDEDRSCLTLPMSLGTIDDPIGVFLLDDHEVVRRGVRDLLEAEDGIEVVGEAGTAAEALARVPA